MGTRVALVVVSIVAAQSASADTLRCGSKLISEGDPIEKVLQYCGEPVAKKRTWITRQPRFEYGGQEIPFEGTEDVPVDLWTYDFGANKLMRRIRFMAGKVESIETLEHGTAR
jgi:hypothetical protein